MKKIATIALGVIFSMSAFAQEIETTISADVVNQYIWRGQDLGNVSLQPTLGVAYKGLSLTGWGSVGLATSESPITGLTQVRIPKAATSSTMPMALTTYSRPISDTTSK